MFTGIIEDTGRLVAVEERGGGAGALRQLEIATALADEELAIGSSLSVDGACLTVVAWSRRQVAVTAAPETLERTTLGRLRPGARVNLERALRLGDRLNGHWVMGHVDGVGRVQGRKQRGAAVDLMIHCAPELLRYVVEKGSIAVHGVSLTVNSVDESGFSVSLIQHTQGATTLVERVAAHADGAEVNLEVDVLGKYVEKLLGTWSRNDRHEESAGGLTREKLLEHGFGGDL